MLRSVCKLCASVFTTIMSEELPPLKDSKFSASIPIRGLLLDIASLCTDVPVKDSTFSLATASGFSKPSSSISNLALIPLLISSLAKTSLRGLM